MQLHSGAAGVFQNFKNHDVKVLWDVRRRYVCRCACVCVGVRVRVRVFVCSCVCGWMAWVLKGHGMK